RLMRQWQQPTHLLVKLHCWPCWSTPRTPVPLVRSTKSPRDSVCAVWYSQLRKEGFKPSSLHCDRAGAELSTAQNDVTVLFPTSWRPTRSPAASALWSSAYEHTCFPEPQ